MGDKEMVVPGQESKTDKAAEPGLLIGPPSDGITDWEERVNADARREKGLLPGVRPSGSGHQSS